MAERLQKVLAQAGVASRRAAEQLILEGRVRVNGRVERVLGRKVDARRDKVEVDGRRIVAEKPAYYVLHKPRAVVSTLSDPEGRDTVKTLLRGVPERVFSVGRLDYHTSGVLLFTNDGDFSEALLRPSARVPKTYVAKMRGSLDVPQLDQLRNGVTLDDGYRTKPAKVFVVREEGKNTWIQLTLFEGKNRQIHRMGDAIGRKVLRLARTEFADVSGDGLRPGEWRPLRARELDKIKRRYLKGAPKRQTRSHGADDSSEPSRSPARKPSRKKNHRHDSAESPHSPARKRSPRKHPTHGSAESSHPRGRKPSARKHPARDTAEPSPPRSRKPSGRNHAARDSAESPHPRSRRPSRGNHPARDSAESPHARSRKPYGRSHPARDSAESPRSPARKPSRKKPQARNASESSPNPARKPSRRNQPARSAEQSSRPPSRGPSRKKSSSPGQPKSRDASGPRSSAPSPRKKAAAVAKKRGPAGPRRKGRSARGFAQKRR